MKLVTMEVDGRPRAGLIDGEDIIDIHACDASIPGEVRGHSRDRRARARARAGRLDEASHAQDERQAARAGTRIRAWCWPRG